MTFLFWIILICLVCFLFAFDLGVFHRKEKRIPPQEALAWTALWISLGLAFNLLVFFLYDGHRLGGGILDVANLTGKEAALQFFTCYLIQKSLSVDLMFFIALIVVYFEVPMRYQHRILFWGVIGALVFRAVMIITGTSLIQVYPWLTYLFGLTLFYSAIRLLIAHPENINIERNPAIKFVKRFIPVTDRIRSDGFISRINGKRAVTPMLLALLAVESADIHMAFDSIPANISITRDNFIIFTSNVFALLGLRSMYFSIAGMINKFRFLKKSLVLVMIFISLKMILTNHYQIEVFTSLLVISTILSLGFFASVIFPRGNQNLISPLEEELEDIATLTIQKINKIFIILLGSSLIIIGILLLVLPGPGIITIILGLSILGPQFLWARRLRARIKEETDQIEVKIRKVVDDSRRKMRPPD